MRGSNSWPVTVDSSTELLRIPGKTSTTGMRSPTDSGLLQPCSDAQIRVCRPKSFSTSDWVTFSSSETRGKRSPNP
jgi:hypothetical protein